MHSRSATLSDTTVLQHISTDYEPARRAPRSTIVYANNSPEPSFGVARNRHRCNRAADKEIKMTALRKDKSNTQDVKAKKVESARHSARPSDASNAPRVPYTTMVLTVDHPQLKPPPKLHSFPHSDKTISTHALVLAKLAFRDCYAPTYTGTHILWFYCTTSNYMLAATFFRASSSPSRRTSCYERP